MAAASWGLLYVGPSLVLLLPIMGELSSWLPHAHPTTASVGTVTTDLMSLLLPLNAPRCPSCIKYRRGTGWVGELG